MKMKMITISFAAIIGLFGIIEVEATPLPTGESSGIQENLNYATEGADVFEIGYQNGKFRLNILGNVYEVKNPLNFVFGGDEDVTENPDINSKTKHTNIVKNRKKFDVIGGDKVSHKNKPKVTKTSLQTLYHNVLDMLGLKKIFGPKESVSNSTNPRKRESLINNVFISGNNHSNGTEPSFNITQDVNINSYQVNHYNVLPNYEDRTLTNIPNQVSNDSIIDNSNDITMQEDNLNRNPNLYDNSVEKGSNNSNKINSGKQHLRSLKQTELITSDNQFEENSSKKQFQKLLKDDENRHFSEKNSENSYKDSSKYYTHSKGAENMKTSPKKSKHHLNKTKTK